MSKITIALETAVSVVLENTPEGDVRQTSRQRANADRAFMSILKLIAPRIRHFIRQYGLTAHWDDAEQCCAIGVHRAIQAYDPAKAQFTTFVNWQLRGELQSLRFRLMADQRPSAKKVDATTVSLHSISTSIDGEETSLESIIEDGEAWSRTEAGASDLLAEGARSALMDDYVKHLRTVGMEQLQRRARSNPALRQACAAGTPRMRSQTLHPLAISELEDEIALFRDVVARRIFDGATLDEVGEELGVTKERLRQITKRATKTLADIATADPRYGIASSSVRPAAVAHRRKPAARAKTTLVPEIGLAHNRFATVAQIANAPTTPAHDEVIDTAFDHAPHGMALLLAGNGKRITH